MTPKFKRVVRITVPIVLVAIAVFVAASYFNDQSDGLRSAIAATETPVVYVGLPDEKSEKFAPELAGNETIKIGGFYFYAQPAAINEADLRQLKTFLNT